MLVKRGCTEEQIGKLWSGNELRVWEEEGQGRSSSAGCYDGVMPQLPTPDTPENWDAASSGYSERVAPVLMQSFAAELVERLNVNDDCEAIEVGAGSGALTATLAAKVKSLLAVDFSPRMIELLSARMAEAGLNHVNCEVMDGQALATADASFDRAASSFAVMLFPDRAKGFSELRRVLRPGGRAVISAWTGPDKFQLFSLFLSALNTALPDLPPPDAPPPVFSLADPAVFRTEMEAAGFRKVEVDFVARDLEIDSFDSLWGMCTTGAPPVKMLLDRIGPGGTERLHDTMQRMVEERFGSGPIRLSNMATVGCGSVT